MRCRETMLCATCTTFSTRGNFYVSPIPFENTLKNWHLKNKQKPAILNGCMSEARANSESKLIFSESSFNFLQKSLARSTHLGTRQGALPPTTPTAAVSGQPCSKS